MASYRDTIRQVTAGTIVPMYLLAGGDAFLEDFFVGEVARRFFAPGFRKQVFSLDDDRAEHVLAELNAYSLFQGKELLVVRQAQRITGKAREELLSYAKNPNPAKCLLLVIEEYQPTKGLHRSLAKSIPVVDTRPPFNDTLRSWVGYYVKLRGFKLPPAARDLLIDLVGDSVGHVVSELDKIFTQLEEGDTVTSELVEDQVNPDRSYQLWHLQEAVASRITDQSLRICVSLIEYGTAPTRIVGALATLFCQLLFIQTGTSMERGYTGLNKSVTARLRSMKQLYMLKETSQILRKLLAVDVSLKSTSVEPDQLLIPLIVGICHGIV
ncbi:DNA polymerase III subunit delta [Candidatus Neomarinimicrobiota bacterium]